MRGVMLKAIPIILLVLAATAVGQDFFQYGFSTVDYSYLGSGARALSMGGAFIGVADDASALTWNPAGLTQIDRTQASVAGSYLKLEQKTKLSYTAGAANDFSATDDDNKLKLSYASFVAPLRLKGHPFMTSATYRAAQDRLESWYSWADVDQAYITATLDSLFYTARRENKTEITGGLDIFSFGFGTGLYGDISCGGAINIYSGTGQAAFWNQYIDTVASSFAGVADTVELIRAQSVGDEFSTSGFNFVGSLFYRSEMFRVGLKFETPFELITDHDLTRRDTLYENGLPTFPIGDRARLYRGKTKFDMPWVVGGGVSATPKPNIVISGDVEVRRFSEAKYLVERDTLFNQRGTVYFPYNCMDADTCALSHFTSSGDRVEVYDEFNMALRNSVQFRAGAEYTLQTKYGVIPVRAGARVTKLQYTDVTGITRDEHDLVQPGFQLQDRVTRTTLTFGSGIHWRQIWLDFAVALSSEKQKETGSNSIGSYEVTRERSTPSVMFNFTGFF